MPSKNAENVTKYCITFSGDRYHNTTARIVEDAPKYGADKVLVYDDYWVTRCRPDFIAQNKWAWDHPKTRGFGWFIWKPFIILDALERASNGDIVMFIDADTYPIANFSMLYDICAKQGGVMLFSSIGHPQLRWCKRDCFIVMGQDRPEYTSPTVQAGVARFMLFQKGPWRPKQFLMEWLAYCCNPLANTFDPSVLAPEYAMMHEHRCEQAILTNLAHKYHYKLWREACGYGNNFPDDKEVYGQLFVQDGNYSYGLTRGAGSCFRNVND